jgi:hypothetical protein
MTDPQRKRSWLVSLVVATAAMLHIPSASAQASIKEASSTDETCARKALKRRVEE